MKHLKMLAIALVAIGAMSAVVAQAASAAKIGTSEGYPVRLTGAQVGEHVFKIENDTLEVKCPVALFAGEIGAESESVSGVTAEYKGEGEKVCKAFGINATVSMNGCTYTFNAGAETAKDKFSGSANVACPTSVIKVVTATCEVQIGAQTGLSPVNYEVMTNTPTSKDDITVNPAISKTIAYKETKDGIGCPLTHLNEARTDGSYVGTTTVKGENPTTLVEKELFIK